MRAKIRDLILSVVGPFKNPSKGIHILNGHYINKTVGDTDFEQFDRLLRKLSKSFTFLRFEEACELIKSGKLPNKPCLSFSFDDGFSECYSTIVPVLEKYQTNACFFINPAVIEKDDAYRLNFIRNQLKNDLDKRFMAWDQIHEIHQRGQVIGNHTLNHQALLNMPYQDAFEEVRKGKVELETRLNFECKYFAIPFGTPDFFDETGLKAACDNHEVVFTSSFEYQHYFYKNNPAVLSRRHFEGSWAVSHLNYFLSQSRNF